MKINNLHISSLNQLKEINFNFTFPNGHPRAGEALDKVCFIGQSGTGKTSLLKVIGGIIERGFRRKGYAYQIAVESADKSLRLTVDNSIKGIAVGHIFQNNSSRNVTNDKLNDEYIKLVQECNPLIIYMPANFLSKEIGKSDDINKMEESKVYSFTSENIQSIWHKILDDIKKHKSHEIEIRTKIQELSKVSDLPAKAIKDILNDLYDELSRLEEVENNPLKKIANECLDIVLSNFKLRVDTKFSVTENLDTIDFIRIIDKNDNPVPNGVLSTGTLQFILSSLPFYLLKPNNTIILFDEPERSLYPDIQKMLVNHYNKFTNNSQFFYATHSPIVASCFDPWEVFELKFNNEGNVYIEQYYEGDRHVNNYKIHPKYLTYELILKEVFDVKNTDGDDRARLLTELIMLEEKLKQFKLDGDNTSDSFKTTMEEYQRIGKLLSWPVKFD